MTFIEQNVLPTLELCKRLEAEKKIVAGGPVSGGIALAMIVRVESIQELDELVESLPCALPERFAALPERFAVWPHRDKNGTWNGFWECSTGLGERSTQYHAYAIVRPVVSPKRHFATKVCRDCHQDLPRGATRTVFCPQKRVVSASVFAARVCGKFATHGNAFWQRPRAMLATFNAVDMPGNSLQPLYC